MNSTTGFNKRPKSREREPTTESRNSNCSEIKLSNKYNVDGVMVKRPTNNFDHNLFNV